MRELIALAKAKPGKLNFAIGALGSSLHMAGEAFKMQSGAYIVNIPYRGTAPAVQDVLAGQVQLMFADGRQRAGAHQGRQAQGAGRDQRPGGCRSSPTCRRLPRVLPGYESSAWFGLFGPAHMPPELAQPHQRRGAPGDRRRPTMRKRFESEGAIAGRQFAGAVRALRPERDQALGARW